MSLCLLSVLLLYTSVYLICELYVLQPECGAKRAGSGWKSRRNFKTFAEGKGSAESVTHGVQPLGLTSKPTVPSD